MIQHLIVFNIREDATHQECLSMLEKAKNVLSQIPGVLKVSYGAACSESSRYKYTIAVDFQNASIIESYKYHPLHAEFAEQDFRPLAIDRITTDYEILG